MRALIEGTTSRILLCERAELLVGSVSLDDHGGTAHLGMFAVEPRLQAAGIGRSLLV